MGIDIQIYLTEVPLPSTLPCPPFSCTLILSLFPSRSLLAFFFPATKTVTRNRCKLLGVGKGTGKKRICISLVFFFLPFFGRRYSRSRSGTETAPTDARIRTVTVRRSSIFRAAFPPPEDLDLEKRDGVALQGLSMRTRVLK